MEPVVEWDVVVVGGINTDTSASRWNDVIVGVVLMGLSIPRGRIEERFGGWNRYLVWWHHNNERRHVWPRESRRAIATWSSRSALVKRSSRQYRPRGARVIASGMLPCRRKKRTSVRRRPAVAAIRGDVMKLAPIALSAGAVALSILAARHIKRRRRETLGVAADLRATGWSVADEISQAASNAAPHESGALNVAPRPADE
jgi:hypothetical protein